MCEISQKEFGPESQFTAKTPKLPSVILSFGLKVIDIIIFKLMLLYTYMANYMTIIIIIIFFYEKL